jgi:hypothetical protein
LTLQGIRLFLFNYSQAKKMQSNEREEREFLLLEFMCYRLCMRFQKRAGEILQAIYHNDGVLAMRHLKELFWPDKTLRAMEQRLPQLHKIGSVDWPNNNQYKTNPIPEPVCWLIRNLWQYRSWQNIPRS